MASKKQPQKPDFEDMEGSTFRQIFEAVLPEDIAKRAIENTNTLPSGAGGDDIAFFPRYALAYAFQWDESTEGESYWKEINAKYFQS